METTQLTAVADSGDGRRTGALDILLIKLAHRCFGLSLSDVRQICPIPSGFACCGTEVEERFVYQGYPLPYVSLWNLFRLESEYREYQEIRTMLSQRRQDHLDWMVALEDSISRGTEFSKARNPRECAFGKWYYGYRPRDLRLSLLLRNFERPHAEIHRLADRLLNMVEAGQVDSALQAFQASKETTLSELLKLFDSTLELLIELQRRIAVIVENGDDVCALGADGVLEIVAVPSECVHPNTSVGGEVASAMIVLNDQSVVPLIDFRSFTRNEKPLDLDLAISERASEDEAIF